MAYYSYKRLRSLIPENLADKYEAMWKERQAERYHKAEEISRLINLGNSKEYAEEIYSQQEWYWDNSYDGDLFDAAADYIEFLEGELNGKL